MKNKTNKIKRERVITEIDGLKIGDEVPAFEGHIASFFKEEGVWMVEVRDAEGAYVINIEELKEMQA
jgi:hypothetical protein